MFWDDTQKYYAVWSKSDIKGHPELSVSITWHSGKETPRDNTDRNQICDCKLIQFKDKADYKGWLQRKKLKMPQL